MISHPAPALRGALTIVLLLASLAVAPGSARAEDAPRLVAVEVSTPPLVLDALAGQKVSLPDGQGRVRLVHFFATWCEPCRPELASLDALREARSGAGIDILAVSVAEPEARLKRYFADNPTGLTILLDRDRATSRAWRIEALPSTLVVDRAGKVRLAVRGDLDWARDDVRSALDGLFSERGSRSAP